MERSELQLGALYGRYRHWRSPAPLVTSEDAATESPDSLCALVVQFEASTREDLRVGFAPSSSSETPKKPPIEWKYEVAIGSSGNTELVWRKAAVGRNTEVVLARVFTGRICSLHDFVGYWVVVDLQKGFFSIGVGPHVGQDVLSTVQDPDFTPITQTAFTSWDAPVTLRNIQVHGVYDVKTLDVTSFPPPRAIIRADPLGSQDLLTPEQHQQYETEYRALQRRAERFGAPFVPPELKKFLDPREVRKLQRTGASVPGFSTGIDVLSHDEQTKREQRMKRFETPEFALQVTGETVKALEEGMTQEEWTEKQQEQQKLRARAQKFGLLTVEDRSQSIDLTPATAKVQRERCDVTQEDTIRDDALHMYSLDDKFQQVRTHDVMEYFVGYGPAYVEWTNDSSCTIVFQDSFTAARALLARSRVLPRQTKDDKDVTDGDIDMVDATDGAEQVEELDANFTRSCWQWGDSITSQTQPNKTWRILLRKATDADFPPEKLPKKELYHSRGAPTRRRARAHPYKNSESSGTRHRKNRNTGTPSKRIRVNADGSINIIRDEKKESSVKSAL